MQNTEGLSPIRVFFRNKWVRIILCFDILIALIAIGIAIYNSTKTAIITFDITPVDATISVNGGTNHNTSSTHRLRPGTYHITISHNNLDSKSFTLDLPDHSTTKFSTYLSAQNGTDFSFYELRENHSSAQRLLSIASPSDNQTYDQDTSAKQFVSAYGATLDAYNNNLPISDFTRNSPDAGGNITSIISIQKDDSCAKYLCVLGYTIGIPNGTQRVDNSLRDAGLDLKYLEIKYDIH